MNCDENELLCTQDPWKIEGYPTLFLHRMGKATEYEDETEKNAIVEFMREVTQPRPKVTGQTKRLGQSSLTHVSFSRFRFVVYSFFTLP